MSSRSRHQYCPYDATILSRPADGSAPGGRCPLCGYVDYQNPRPCVGCFIHDAGRVLLSRRAVEPARGEWDLVGGFIEPGETAEDAVRREVREETTLRVEPAAYLGSLPDVYGDRDYPTLNLIYLVRRVSGDPKPKDDVAELGWFEIDAIPDLAFPHQLQAVRLLRHHLGRADR